MDKNCEPQIEYMGQESFGEDNETMFLHNQI
jgi:hypothetical protein